MRELAEEPGFKRLPGLNSAAKLPRSINGICVFAGQWIEGAALPV